MSFPHVGAGEDGDRSGHTTELNSCNFKAHKSQKKNKEIPQKRAIFVLSWTLEIQGTQKDDERSMCQEICIIWPHRLQLT